MTSDTVNTYLTTEYLYHWTCMTCGHVHHAKPSGGGDDCPKCGRGSWTCRTITTGTLVPWYVQLLDPECPTCRKTLAKLTSLEGQMTLFEVQP